MNRHEISEQIDACQLGQLDIQAPEFDELRAAIAREPSVRRQFERAQAADRRIRDALLTVEPPSGFQSRLLAALAKSEAAESSSSVPPDDTVSAALQSDEGSESGSEIEAGNQIIVERRLRLSSRRGWIALAVSSAAALLIAVWLGSSPTTNVAPGDLPELAIRYHRGFDATRDWKPLSQRPPLAPARQLEQRLITGWLEANELLGDRRRGLAFRLQSPTGLPATLYTIEGNWTGLADGPVAAQPIRTGGLWAAAWQSEGQLFVLVIPTQDPNAFRQFLPNRGGLASRKPVQITAS